MKQFLAKQFGKCSKPSFRMNPFGKNIINHKTISTGY